jgi:sec-independent protein translocase protein TatC
MTLPQRSSDQLNFLQHLEELRTRLMHCLLFFVLGCCIFYGLSDFLLELLRRPLFQVLPVDQRKLYFTNLFENFLTHLKIAGYASIFFFSPLYFYQIWAFVAPGLRSQEKKMVLPFIFAATFFFLGGACFAYFVLFPVGFHYFIHYANPSEVPLLTIDAYYGTCLKLLLLFGLAFEFPVLVCLLGFLGLVDAAFLKANRRTAILGITLVSAFAAPPDAVSMLLLGVPLVLLYEAAIFVVATFSPHRGRKI